MFIDISIIIFKYYRYINTGRINDIPYATPSVNGVLVKLLLKIHLMQLLNALISQYSAFV